jgi:hypothetical protein
VAQTYAMYNQNRVILLSLGGIGVTIVILDTVSTFFTVKFLIKREES